MQKFRPQELVVVMINETWLIGRVKRLLPNQPDTYEIYTESNERTIPVWAKYLHPIENDWEIEPTGLGGRKNVNTKFKKGELCVVGVGDWLRLGRIVEKVRRKYRVTTGTGNLLVSPAYLSKIQNLYALQKLGLK